MKINGKQVPLQLFEREWQRLWQMKQQKMPSLQGMDEQQMRHLTEENVIKQFLLDDEVRRRNEHVSRQEIDDRLKAMIEEAGNEKRFLRQHGLKRNQLDAFRKTLAHSIRRELFFNEVLTDAGLVTEDEAYAAYTKNITQFGSPEQIHASHIVKHRDACDQAEAEKVLEAARARLAAGEDFAAVAEELSDCKGKGGDLGWFPREQMVEAFDQVVFNMDIGAVSGVFETEFGFHVVKLHGKQPGSVTPFEEVKGKLLQELQREREHNTIEEFVAQLRAKANIQP